MTNRLKHIKFLRISLALLLLILLSWLTVCLPVFSWSQQSFKNFSCDTPVNNIPEEKPSGNSSVNLNEEFIHHDNEHCSPVALLLIMEKPLIHDVILKTYHHEQLVPPPEFS